MPRAFKIDVDPNEHVYIQVAVPGWMKSRAGTILQRRGKTMTDWVKDQLRELIDEEDETRGKSRRPR